MPASAFKSVTSPSPAAKEDYERRLAAWKAAGWPDGRFDDPGVAEAAKSWAQPRTETRDWRSMSLPQAWERVGPDMEVDGGVWFRKEIDVPAGWSGKDLDLSLGALDDFDSTYFNGVRVGATGADTSHFWETPRRYKVPAAIVKAGRAVIAVRVWDQGAPAASSVRRTRCGSRPSAAVPATPSGGTAVAPRDAVRLAGDWRFQVEVKRPLQSGRAARQRPQRPELAL